MENIIINPNAGANFDNVAKQALITATNKQNVEFDFNGVKCIVSPTTNIKNLYRDYANSWRMEWEIVGPDCLPEYTASIMAELEKRNIEAELKASIQRAESKRKDANQRKIFIEKTKGVELDLLNIDEWNKWKAKNTDGYGNAIFEYAENWAKLMQVEMSKGVKLEDCAQRTSFELGFLGISGAQYGAAVGVLENCWKYGNELWEWHLEKRK